MASKYGGLEVSDARKPVVLNHMKLYRLYREERLMVRKRGGRKRALGTRAPMGRQKMEREFDERIVIDRYQSAIGGLAAKKKSLIVGSNNSCLAAQPKDQART